MVEHQQVVGVDPVPVLDLIQRLATPLKAERDIEREAVGPLGQVKGEAVHAGRVMVFCSACKGVANFTRLVFMGGIFGGV